MYRMRSEEEYENILNDIWNKYIAPAYSNPGSHQYYVDDIANCENKKVEYIILCESPHTEEVEHKDNAGISNPIPLVGTSGKAVSAFLFGERMPIGELIAERNNVISHKLAIVNVCNVPLQEIDQNKDDIRGLNMNYLRDNCKVIKALCDNLKDRFKKYENIRTIIVCGEFAREYYNVIKDELDNLKNATSLYVPHPSRNQWQLVYEYRNVIATLKTLFTKKD